MKKQFFTLIMVLAVIVFAGTSAMAQSDGLTVATAYWHLPGSTHGVQVAEHTNTSYSWVINNYDCSPTKKY